MRSSPKLRILYLVGAVGLSVTSARAQSPSNALLRGRVVADSSGTPIAGAEVLLLSAGRSTRSGTGGEFLLSDVPPGLATLRVRHPKYGASEQAVRVAPTDTLDLRVVLTPLAPEMPVLPTVAISATADVGSSPLLNDFRRRRESNNGTFLTAADIQKIGSQSLRSLVQGHVGGFDLLRHPSGMGTAFGSRRAPAPRRLVQNGPAPNECYSNVWVNGQLVYYTSPIRQDPPRLEDFELSRITALEFYRGAAETPTELNAMSAACGTVVFWVDLK